ncbi:MAG: hypothetical protein Q8R00_00315 [Candidatus Nanoarchaeia archaeon]|nr:hypothetical protein [Candidatus Nanoarchaeia archaeon]
MPIIEKLGSTVWVRKSDFRPIPRSEVNSVPEENRVRKIAKTVYVYTKEEFNAFNVKHVQRIPFGRYTVIIKNGIEKPTISEVKEVINMHLLLGEFGYDITFVDLRKPYTTARWNSVLRSLVPDTNNQILFRDIKEINNKNIQKELQDKLEKIEYNALINMLKNVSESEYVIIRIYLIKKILVV